MHRARLPIHLHLPLPPSSPARALPSPAQAHRIMRQQREAYEQRREQQYATSAYALVQYKSSDRPYITYAGLDAAAAGRTRRPDVTGA
mmetsp:Transcript_41163/g.109969  ORF Transcript_41163/g.109969 Transcript_41163/m.109969 type:complete len:88 (+) Transcript_41163:758-1021(+)